MEEEQESSGEESSLSSSVLSPPSSSRIADEDFDFLAPPAFGFPQSWPISFFNSFALALLCLWLQVAAGFDVVGFEEGAAEAGFFSSLVVAGVALFGAGALLLVAMLGFIPAMLEGGSGIGSSARDFGRDSPDSPAGVTLIPSLAFEVTLIPSLVFEVTLIPSLLSVVTLMPSFSNFLGSLVALDGKEVVVVEERESTTLFAL